MLSKTDAEKTERHRLMMWKLFYFFLCVAIFALSCGYSMTSVPSLTMRVIAGGILGVSIGVLAFADRKEPITRYAVASICSIFQIIFAIVFVMASTTANFETFIAYLFVAAMLFFALTRP